MNPIYRVTVFLLALMGLADLGFGFESYRFVEADCQAHTGLIVNADPETIHLLTIEGKFRRVPRNRIKYILVYNTVNNPIASVELSGELRDLLRDVHLTSMDEHSLSGWPIQFIEDLVVFFDLQGKTNLIDQDRILAIRPSTQTATGKTSLKNSKPMTFSFGNNLPDCERSSKSSHVQPTRMISDKIKINEFMYGYEQGFRQLERFQRRTRYYARPFLYERRTRLGFTVVKEGQELPVDFLPLSLQWSSGRSYSHQSVIKLGYHTIEWLPNVEPLFAASSELKLHFFSASVAGNLFSLPGGTSFLVPNKALFTGFFSNLDEDVAVLPQFNYLALTGMDFERHSVGVGVVYAMYGILGDGYFREVLASRSSFIGRYMYTEADRRYRIVYSSSDLGSSDPDDKDIAMALSTEHG